MNRSQFNSIPHNEVVLSVPVDKKVYVQENDVLNQIFAIDKSTGLPRNDEAVFLSEKTNPLVKQYIQTQLRRQDKPSGNPWDGIPADDLEALTRNHDETRSEYAARVQKYLDGIKKDFNEQLKREAKKADKSKQVEPKTE